MEQISTSGWVQIVSTIILAAAAFLAPYIVEKWKFNYRVPKLSIEFKLAAPDCHLTQFYKGGFKYFVYYFRFLVKNVGKSQAEDCQVFLEKIFKKDKYEKMIEYKDFTPVNLKWSGVSNPIERNIYPDKGMYCDLGRIYDKNYKYRSVYKNIIEEEQALNNFFFEFAENRLYSNWDCLIPGSYKIIVSVYSKNAKKVTRQFNLSWSGKWEDKESDMFEELFIK